MTREEAIARIQDHMEHHGIGKYPHIKLAEALNIAISALTPPTQEQMERVFRAEWLNFYNDYSTAECSKCEELFEVSPDEQPRKEFFDAFNQFYKFCPSCGRAMTPEAWEEMRKRWEALNDAES